MKEGRDNFDDSFLFQSSFPNNGALDLDGLARIGINGGNDTNLQPTNIASLQRSRTRKKTGAIGKVGESKEVAVSSGRENGLHDGLLASDNSKVLGA